MNDIKSKQRVADHGEVFTPSWMAEWGYLGKGKFQRRDFRLDSLTQSSSYVADLPLFTNQGKHEIFTPTKTYPPMTVGKLAEQDNRLNYG